MSYVIAINHNRGISFFCGYDKNFGTVALAKKYENRERAELALQNVSEYLPELLEVAPMYEYLGYDRASLRILELKELPPKEINE